MRFGEKDEAKALLLKVAELSLATNEGQRLIPVACAMLEYQWLFNEKIEDQRVIDFRLEIADGNYHSWAISEFAFWLTLNGISFSTSWKLVPAYELLLNGNNKDAVALMLDKGCTYEAAIMLSNGDENDQRKALDILDSLGTIKALDKVRGDMKTKGYKNIPSGARKSTKSNPAMLTNRQLDVLQELGNGLQNIEIAEKLFISSKTVEHHMSSIFVKLDVNSRSKAVIKAKELRILV